MDASSAREFGEERAREVAVLVGRIKEQIDVVDEWIPEQPEDFPFLAVATRTSVNNIVEVYGQLVELNGSWTRKTTQLTDTEEACKLKLEELRLETEKVARQFSILEAATADQGGKKAEVERELQEKSTKVKELEQKAEAREEVVIKQISTLETARDGLVTEKAEVERLLGEKSSQVKELEQKAAAREEAITKQISNLETAKDSLAVEKAWVEKLLVEKSKRVDELEAGEKDRLESVSKQISTLETATSEMTEKKVEMEKRSAERDVEVEELERKLQSKAELKKQLAGKDGEIAKLADALRAQQAREESAVAASIAAQKVEMEKRLRAEFEVEKEEWRNRREAGFAASREKEASKLQKVAGEMQEFLVPGKTMLANDKKMEGALGALERAARDYDLSKDRRDAERALVEREREEQARRLQEELGMIPEERAFLDRRAELLRDHCGQLAQRSQAQDQRDRALDDREREIYTELGVKAAEIPELGHAVNNFRKTAYGWNVEVIKAVNGLASKVDSVKDALASLREKREREDSENEGPVQKRARIWRGAAEGPVVDEEETFVPTVMPGEEREEEMGGQIEADVEARLSVARQVNDREPSNAEEDVGGSSPSAPRSWSREVEGAEEQAEEDGEEAGEGSELQELKNRIDASFVEICGSVGLPDPQAVQGKRKKGKQTARVFEPTTADWVVLFDKDVRGTPYTHGGGSRICFMASNGRLRATFPVEKIGGNDVVQNQERVCATHKATTVGDGQECVFVEWAPGKDADSDWRGAAKWIVSEHPA